MKANKTRTRDQCLGSMSEDANNLTTNNFRDYEVYVADRRCGGANDDVSPRLAPTVGTGQRCSTPSGLVRSILETLSQAGADACSKVGGRKVANCMGKLRLVHSRMKLGISALLPPNLWQLH